MNIENLEFLNLKKSFIARSNIDVVRRNSIVYTQSKFFSVQQLLLEENSLFHETQIEFRW